MVLKMKQVDFSVLENSPEEVYFMADCLLTYPEKIPGLINFGLHSFEKASWRALWVADKIHEKQPALIRPFIAQMVDALQTTDNESKLRHLLKLISLNELPPEKLSFLLDFCLRELTDAARPVAIRVHAMQILYEISVLEPDFKPELAQVIEHEMDFHGSAGINSRGKVLLKKLHANS